MEIVNAISLIESADMSTVNKTLTTISNFQKVVQATLKDGFDFGVIPGTPKPTLYKPGAEKICQLMKVNPEYEFLDRVTDFDKGFFNYELRCTLFHNLINEKGELIRIPMAQGVGSCNSKEKKYRWQNVQEKDLPDDVDKSTLKSTTNKWGKTLYTIENTDPYTLANTILKMAKKRAFIDATLQLAALSQVFSQDIEDIKDLLVVNDSADAVVSGNIVASEPNDPADFRMEKGKFAGVPLSKLYDDGEISYIEWLASKINNPEINKIASAFLLSKGKPNNPIIPTKTAFEKAKDVTEQTIPFPDDKDCPLPFDL